MVLCTCRTCGSGVHVVLCACRTHCIVYMQYYICALCSCGIMTCVFVVLYYVCCVVSYAVCRCMCFDVH